MSQCNYVVYRLSVSLYQPLHKGWEIVFPVRPQEKSRLLSGAKHTAAVPDKLIIRYRINQEKACLSTQAADNKTGFAVGGKNKCRILFLVSKHTLITSCCTASLSPCKKKHHDENAKLMQLQCNLL